MKHLAVACLMMLCLFSIVMAELTPQELKKLNQLNKEGQKAFYTSNYQEAITKWQKGLDISEESGDKKYIATFTGNMGLVYWRNNQYAKALTYFENAIHINTEIGSLYGKCANLVNIGVIYDNLGQYDKALRYYKEAQHIQSKTGNSHDESAILTNIGIIYINKGMYQKALEYIRKALYIDRNIKNLYGEGKDLSKLGDIYQYIGQYKKALEYFKSALAIHKKNNNWKEQSDNLIFIAIVNSKIGEYDNALIYYEKAWNIAKEINDKYNQGLILSNFGIMNSQFKQYKEAAKYYKMALSIFKQLGTLKAESAACLSNLGVTFEELKQYGEALEYYQNALNIYEEIGNLNGQGINLLNKGILYQKIGQYRKAHQLLKESLNLFKRSNASDDLWKTLQGLAEVEVTLKQYENAEEHYIDALSAIERLRSQFSDKEVKFSFMRNKIDTYDKFIEFYQNRHKENPKKGYDQKAIEIFERKQGRIFLEEMGKSGSRYFADLPDNIRSQEISLDNGIPQAEKQLSDEQSKSEKDWNHTKIQTLQDRISKLKEKETALKARIEKEHPDYYALKYPTPVKLAELQKDVLKAGEGMLIYNVMEESACLWFVSKKDFLFSPIEIKEKNLGEKIKGVRSEGADRLLFYINVEQSPLMKIKQEVRKGIPLFDKKSAELADLLVPENVRSLLADVKTLYIVPTGSLYNLPFESLKINDHYLVEDYALSYLSSASLLKNIRDAQARRKETKREPLLAFADPVYGVNGKKHLEWGGINTPPWPASYKDRIKAYIGEKGKLRSLPDTEDEIKLIDGLLNKKGQNNLNLQARASEKHVFELQKQGVLKNYKYIVFSCHGLIPDKEKEKSVFPPIQPALALSTPQPGDAEENDGFLEMRDIFGLSFNADFIALSACNTGRQDKSGNITRGEGARGLTRSFMYAGTPAVSVTLWEVESNSSKVMNAEFFGNMNGGMFRAEALRRIKLEMINGEHGKLYEHPYFWSPLVMFGDAM